MYFIPYGLFIKAFDPAFASAHQIDLTSLSWGSFFLKNLLPVTIGNIIGGAGLVAVVYWFIYLNKAKTSQEVNVAARKLEKPNA
jgi:formate/nitrite transporter FocA (FNT family)